VEALLKLEELSFTEGLNILWGRNGAGKSTLLHAIARLFHCEQGGTSTITSHSLSQLRSSIFHDSEPLSGITCEHDGKPMLYVNPGNAIGLIGGLAGFDPDFSSLGTQNAMYKGSSGQTTDFRMIQVLGQPIPDEIPWKIPRRDTPVCAFVEKFLEANSEPGRVTLLLDEPERSLDWESQLRLWDTLTRTPRFQCIVATHSPLAMNIASANYIELSPTYLDMCRAIFSIAFEKKQ
jgi:energy-coupling factor transporter ATP-binding protein EcfA2